MTASETTLPSPSSGAGRVVGIEGGGRSGTATKGRNDGQRQRAAGRQTAIFSQCLIKGGILAKFDASEDTLEEDIEGTFEDFDLPEVFALLPGMN